VFAQSSALYNTSISAHAITAKTDGTQLTAEDGALGPPGFALLIAPVLIAPAEQEFAVVTTEKVGVAATAVALNVTPLTTMVCGPAALPPDVTSTSNQFNVEVHIPVFLTAKPLQSPRPVAVVSN